MLPLHSRPEHHSIARLKEREVEKGSGLIPSSKVRNDPCSTRQTLVPFQGQLNLSGSEGLAAPSLAQLTWLRGALYSVSVYLAQRGWLFYSVSAYLAQRGCLFPLSLPSSEGLAVSAIAQITWLRGALYSFSDSLAQRDRLF